VLRIGDPLFQFGHLLVFLGHVVGLLVPEPAAKALGISETTFHVAAATDVLLAVTIALGLGTTVISAWLLFAFWPFSRMVLVSSAPFGYLTRPHIVYRYRLPVTTPRRGWANACVADVADDRSRSVNQRIPTSS
jgi:nitrate reductase gamma subunit